MLSTLYTDLSWKIHLTEASRKNRFRSAKERVSLEMEFCGESQQIKNAVILFLLKQHLFGDRGDGEKSGLNTYEKIDLFAIF